MLNLRELINNPRIEEHLIYYVGMKYMHAHWDEHLDPLLPIEYEVTQLYYGAMLEGLYEDALVALKMELNIVPDKSEWDELLEDAFSVLKAKHGVMNLVWATQDLLRVVQGVESDVKTINKVFAAPLLTCARCDNPAVPLGIEDIPQELLHSPRLFRATMAGYCPNCKELVPHF